MAKLPLQSRIAFADPEWIEGGQFADDLVLLRDKGFNAVAIPVLHQGTVTFVCSRDGTLKPADSPARDAIRAAHALGFSIFLHVDFLTAGPPQTRRFGRLAARHRNWLMRTSRGRHRINQFPEVPGLFCWTTVPFRRYVANLISSIAAGHPIEGLLVDLRRLPRTTNQPRSWTHLGFSSLERIQNELDINIEDFLVSPSGEVLERIDRWRIEELLRFVSLLKARFAVLHQSPLLLTLVAFEQPEDPYAPWLEVARSGLIDELILAGPPIDPAQRLELCSSLVQESRPYLIAFDTEQDAADHGSLLSGESVLGFLVLDPDPADPVSLPPADSTWETEGVPEAEPIEAVTALLAEISEVTLDHPRYGDFFVKLALYFDSIRGVLKYEDGQKIRLDLLRIHDVLLEDHGEELAPEVRSKILVQIGRAVRLLLLCPIPNVEY